MVSPGEHKIGFRSYSANDATRPAVNEQTVQTKGRALQINIWYPAAAEEGPKINFNEYVGLISKEINPDKEDRTQALAAFFDWTFKDKNPSPELLALKQNGAKMNAKMNSVPLGGSFPVVLLVHGGAADFAFLGEYLASHGYVAINVPYKGFRQAELDVGILGMETQVEDFEFALEWIEKSIPLNTDKISVVGVSFGGQSAVSFSFRNKVNCIVSLDGGIGSAFGAGLLQSDENYDLKNIVTPLLHVFNPNDIYTDVSFIRKYTYCDRTLISMKNMEHAHFWSWGALDRLIPNAISHIRPGNSYEAVLQETLNFIAKHSDKEADPCEWCGQYQNYDESLRAGDVEVKKS